jgi:hypothetical protein
METVKQTFLDYPDCSRPDKELLQLLELTLRNNDFEFAGNIYLQTVGTAMGKTYAPSLADLYMDRNFDRKATTGFRIKPILYYRFLDDIFFVWPGTRGELKEFEALLNTLVPGIEITLDIRETITEFLDTRVYKTIPDESEITALHTCVYFKPTDTHQLLHPESNHPKHTLKGVLKSQFIRFKRLSSSHNNFELSTKILWNALSQRGYNRRTFRDIKNKILHGTSTDRQTTSQQSDNGELLPVINLFDKIGVKLTKHRKDLIYKNPHLCSMRVVAAYRKHQNLKQMLVKNKRV